MTKQHSRTAVESGSGDVNRRTRKIVAIILTLVFVGAYCLVFSFYRAGFDVKFSEPTPPTGGVAVVFAPTEVDADGRTAKGDLLLFLSPELKDANGSAKAAVRVELYPSLTHNSLDYPAGKLPSPVAITLPTPGVVQQYPLDTYDVAFTARAESNPGVGSGQPIPTTASVYFQVPGWSYNDSVSINVAASEALSSGVIVRAGSTKLVAALMLILMVALAIIAVLVVQSSATGRMKLELNVASWITAMLFALLPIRGFLPGDPPIGSWIDILVFFWVEVTIMVCVGLAASGLLMRARDNRRGPRRQSGEVPPKVD